MVDLEAEDLSGWTALMHAAVTGEAEAVEALVEAKACIDRPDHQGRSPLFRAARAGHDVVCLNLLEA